MCACVCVYARVYVVYVSVSVRERECVSVYVCMYVRVFDCDWCCATVFLCTGTIQGWRPSAVISRKTRMGWLQNAQKKLGGLAAGAYTNWTYMYIHTHIYTHIHTYMYTHTHEIIHNTQTYTTYATHTHTLIQTHQKCTHDMWRMINLGWNLFFL